MKFMGQKLRKAVFPVAGLGTRFLPATKVIPKEMLTVVDKPVIQYAVEEARAAGIDQFIFVTGRGKTSMVDHFDISFELQQTLRNRGKASELETIKGILAKPGEIAVIRQQVPLGLGHAVLCARQLVGDEPFAVILPDDLVLAERSCLRQMVEAWEEVGGAIVAVADVPRAETNKYGILDVASDDGRLVSVKGMVEKPSPEEAPSTVSIIGRYILPPQIFRHLEQTDQGTGGEIQLTDGMVKLIGEQPFHGLRFEGKRYDCGNKLGFLEANLAFALSRDDTAADVRRIISALL
jgi:UTP--glucose-1-phosphate uridylyltransferase